MKQEEKQIWSAHQLRLAVLSRERASYEKEYGERAKEIMDLHGGNFPIEEQKKMAKEAMEKMTKFERQEHQEIGRYMKEIEDYDRRRNPSPEKQTVNNEQKETEPEKPTLTGGSRFFNSLGYEKLKAQEAPDRSKER